jgi:hypothetical protein
MLYAIPTQPNRWFREVEMINYVPKVRHLVSCIFMRPIGMATQVQLRLRHARGHDALRPGANRPE